MKLQIFSVRDSATDQFGTPMFLMSRGHAVRSFGDEVNNNRDGNIIYAHPDDYELFYLGEFDTECGVFAAVAPGSVCTGKALKIRS